MLPEPQTHHMQRGVMVSAFLRSLGELSKIILKQKRCSENGILILLTIKALYPHGRMGDEIILNQSYLSVVERTFSQPILCHFLYTSHSCKHFA